MRNSFLWNFHLYQSAENFLYFLNFLFLKDYMNHNNFFPEIEKIFSVSNPTPKSILRTWRFKFEYILIIIFLSSMVPSTNKFKNEFIFNMTKIIGNQRFFRTISFFFFFWFSFFFFITILWKYSYFLHIVDLLLLFFNSFLAYYWKKKN